MYVCVGKMHSPRETKVASSACVESKIVSPAMLPIVEDNDKVTEFAWEPQRGAEVLRLLVAL